MPILDSFDQQLTTIIHGSGLNASKPTASATLNGLVWYSTDADTIYKVVAGAWVAQSRTAIQYADNVSVKSVGAVGDGVADDTTAIQCAIAISRQLRKVCFFPSGTYKITSPLDVCGTASSQESFYIKGEIDSYVPHDPAFPGLRGAIIDHSSMLTLPAMLIDRARRSFIKNLAFTGPNTAPEGIGTTIVFPQETGWVTEGVRDTRYSPQCAIAVDSRIGSTPSDGGYPGVTYFNQSGGGSHAVVFQDISIKRSNVGILVGPHAASTNADCLDFINCSISSVQYCLSFASASQNRDNAIRDCNFTYCRAAFTGVTHGTQNGAIPAIFGCQIGYANRAFQFASATGVGCINGMYCESVSSIGVWGLSSSTSKSPLVITGSTFKFQSGSPNFNGLSGMALVAYGPVKFIGCNISNNDGNLYSMNIQGGGIPVSFESCTIGIHSDARSLIGHAPPGLRPMLTLKDCYAVTASASEFIYGGENQVDVMPTRLRVYNSLVTVSSYSDAKQYRLQLPNQGNTNVGLSPSVSSVAWNPTTAVITLSSTPAAWILVGDIITCSLLAQGPASTGATLPALRITSIVGNDLTCEYIVSPSAIDTVTSAGTPNTYMRLVYTHWAPGQALTGDTTNGSPTITNTNLNGAVKVGDWIKGAAGIPSNARVTAVNDTANTITLSANATADGTGVRLYWGELQEIGVTGSPI